MTPLTPVWTERHTTLAAAAGMVAVAVATASAEQWPAPLVVAAATVAAFAGAVAFDAFAGATVGLIAAAAVIVVKRQIGIWTPDAFLVSVTETIGIVLIGVLAGRAGAQLRGGVEIGAREQAGTLAAAGLSTLGLVPRDLGMIRFEDEVERATVHRRPLAVLRISVATQRTAPAERLEIDHAVSRLLESRLPMSAVPFALDSGEMVAVLPETTRAAAGDLVVSLLDALTSGTYVTRSGGRSEVVGDHAEISLGLAFLGELGATAAELLDAATEAVRDPDAGPGLRGGAEGLTA